MPREYGWILTFFSYNFRGLLWCTWLFTPCGFSVATRSSLRSSPGLTTNSFFQFAYCENIIDLPEGQINDPLSDDFWLLRANRIEWSQWPHLVISSITVKIKGVTKSHLDNHSDENHGKKFWNISFDIKIKLSSVNNRQVSTFSRKEGRSNFGETPSISINFLLVPIPPKWFGR